MDKRLLLASPHMSDEGYELEYINDAFRKTEPRRWAKMSTNLKKPWVLTWARAIPSPCLPVRRRSIWR